MGGVFRCAGRSHRTTLDVRHLMWLKSHTSRPPPDKWIFRNRSLAGLRNQALTAK